MCLELTVLEEEFVFGVGGQFSDSRLLEFVVLLQLMFSLLDEGGGIGEGACLCSERLLPTSNSLLSIVKVVK